MSKYLNLAGALVALSLMLTLPGCGKEPTKKKEAASVKLLPATPPPPPPKPEEKKPEPEKQADKPQQQLNQPKTEAPPQPQSLKTDEAPGEGAGNGMQSGAVNSDYNGQKLGDGSGGESAPNPLAAKTYANAATRAINEYLQKDKELKRRDYKVQVKLWLNPEGRMQRVEMVGSTGDESADEAIKSALSRFPGVSAPMPDKMPQPMRLQLSNRMIG
jgi:protein TonB